MKPEEMTILEQLVKGQADMNNRLDKQNNKLEKVTRGLYGEVDNGTTGLIADQKKDEKKFQAIEDKLTAFTGQVQENTAFRKQVKKVTKNTIKASLGGSVLTGGGVHFFDNIKKFVASLLSL